MKKQSLFLVCSLLLGIFLVMLDQFSKLWARNSLEGKEPIRIIDEVFQLQYLEGGNTGAAWGIFSGKTGLLIFVSIAVFFLFFLGFFWVERSFWKNRISDLARGKFRALQITMVVICAGGMGNLIDRFRYGYVIDFFYFKLIDFPIFNVADCYVTVGVVVLAIMLLFVIQDNELDALRRKK